jgi:hypothetical protein
MGTSATASAVMLSANGTNDEAHLSWTETVPWLVDSTQVFKEMANHFVRIASVTTALDFTDTDVESDMTYRYYVRTFGHYMMDGILQPLVNYSAIKTVRIGHESPTEEFSYKLPNVFTPNGDGYNDAWVTEAESRGLSNYRTTPDCVPHLLDEKNVKMLTGQKVFSRSELESRCEIILENYCKTICIEARTMRSMAVKRIAPAVEAYSAELAANMNEKKRALPHLECRFEKEIISELSEKTDQIYAGVQSMAAVLGRLSGDDYLKDAETIRDELIPAMKKLREDGDAAEMLTSKKYWPLPNYGLLMFGEK